MSSSNGPAGMMLAIESSCDETAVSILDLEAFAKGEQALRVELISR